MSYLLIDDGNSRLKWAMTSATGELSQVHIASVDLDLKSVGNECEIPERILISSVGSAQHKQKLNDVFEKKWQRVPEFLSSPAKGLGLINGYKEPERLGSDRWAAMVAAFHVSQSATLVVDVGTALTIDAIDAQGQHLGGLIYPGLALSQQTLLSATNMEAETINTEVNGPVFFGASTEQGIASGTHHALTSLIDRAYSQLSEQLSAAGSSVKPVGYLTGGDAEQIKDTLKFSYLFEPSLVLKGLALIATGV